VRLHREEHRERVSQVNTKPGTKVPADAQDSDEEMIAIDEHRSSRIPPQEDKPWKGVYQDTASIQIKTEPGVTIPSEPGLSFPMHSRSRDPTPAPPPPAINPSSPEFKRPAKELAASSSAAKVEQESPEQKKIKPRRYSKKKDRKPVIQTEEDRAEYERHLEDIAILAHELGGLQSRARDVDGDVAMDGDRDLEVDKKEGRLYLFQFPPVLPRLYNPLNPKEIPAEAPDVEVAGSSTHMDLTKDAEPKGKIKVEEEVIIKKEDAERDGKEKDTNPEEKVIVDEDGFIGKLIVRESGRVELSWGGTSMVLGRGVDAEFLSMGVVVDGKNKDREGEGKAVGMGKIMGKFVVVPDWEKMS
jgi:DNA-directed RNA polymerase III subunit RPC4